MFALRWVHSISSEHFIKNTAICIDIGTNINAFRTPLLGGHIRWSASAYVLRMGQPEVRHHRSGLTINKNVGRL